METPFTNFDFSVRAINSLQVAGFRGMNHLIGFIDEKGIEGLQEFTRMSSKTRQEIKDVLTEQQFIKP